MNFLPWIGNGFGHDNRLDLPARVLIIGESHYDAPATSEITIEVVKEVIAGTRVRFFTSAFKAICGPDTDPTREAVAEFCHSISFYNFVQDMIEAAGVAPSEGQWERGTAAFFECLDSLKPSHVVACGFRLWDNLPEHRFTDCDSDIEVDTRLHLPESYRNNESHQRRGWIGRYQHAGGSCLIVKIEHTSRGFSPAAWHPLLHWFLELDAG